MLVRAVTFAVVALSFAARVEAASCVWKITAPDGKTLYLGGSVHALQKKDYPLPQSFLRAFDASSRLALEVDAKALDAAAKVMVKEGQYRRGDSLKNHVDPRTYAYMRRLFELMNVPEETLAHCRPWLLVVMLQSASLRKSYPEQGVDEYLMKRARARSIPVIGLETAEESVRLFSGLSDRESEILLLVSFIPPDENTGGNDSMAAAWHRGDVEALTRMTQASFREFPSFGERLLDARNRNWLPKIEKFIASGQTYFVVVGAAHIGGANGLLSLLRARGYSVEQLP